MDLNQRLLILFILIVIFVAYIVARFIVLGRKPSKKAVKLANKFFEESVDCEARGDIKGAINSLNKAIDLCEDNHEYYFFRSNAYLKLPTPNFDKALKDITFAMSLKINDVELYRARIEIYKQAGDYNLAYKDAKYICQIAPSIKNYVDCANTALLMKDKKKILQDLQFALDLANKAGDNKLAGLISKKIERLN